MPSLPDWTQDPFAGHYAGDEPTDVVNASDSRDHHAKANQVETEITQAGVASDERFS
jgi:hypothetical protein